LSTSGAVSLGLANDDEVADEDDKNLWPEERQLLLADAFFRARILATLAADNIATELDNAYGLSTTTSTVLHYIS